MSPFFSIVIPTLNEEKYLPKLLQTLLKQTYQSFEVIIVDGGSSDTTPTIASDYKKLFKENGILLTFIDSKDGKTVGMQRNRGSQKAIGTYLAFFDADVTFDANHLQLLFTYIDKQKPVFLTTRYRPDNSFFVDSFIYTIMNIGTYLSLKTKWPMVLGYNIMVRRDLFTRIKMFNPNLKISEDWDLAHRVREAGHEVTYFGGSSLTVSQRRSKKEGRFEVVRKFTVSFIHLMLYGKINDSLFEYKMGGAAHEVK